VRVDLAALRPIDHATVAALADDARNWQRTPEVYRIRSPRPIQIADKTSAIESMPSLSR
jgi:hypothetical protein